MICLTNCGKIFHSVNLRTKICLIHLFSLIIQYGEMTPYLLFEPRDFYVSSVRYISVYFNLLYLKTLVHLLLINNSISRVLRDEGLLKARRVKKRR